MDTASRIKYDSVRGVWKVLYLGKEQDKEFKTSGEAFQHLESLKTPAKKP